MPTTKYLMSIYRSIHIEGVYIYIYIYVHIHTKSLQQDILIKNKWSEFGDTFKMAEE